MLTDETQCGEYVLDLMYQRSVGDAAVTDAHDCITHSCPLIVEPGVDGLVGSDQPSAVDVDDNRQVSLCVFGTIDVQEVLRRAVGDVRDISENGQVGCVEPLFAHTSCIVGLQYPARDSCHQFGHTCVALRDKSKCV